MCFWNTHSTITLFSFFCCGLSTMFLFFFFCFFFFFQAEDGIRDGTVTGVQTCALPIFSYGRGLQIKPPPGFADFANWQISGIPVLAMLTVLFSIGAAIALQRMIYGR